MRAEDSGKPAHSVHLAFLAPRETAPSAKTQMLTKEEWGPLGSAAAVVRGTRPAISALQVILCFSLVSLQRVGKGENLSTRWEFPEQRSRKYRLRGCSVEKIWLDKNKVGDSFHDLATILLVLITAEDGLENSTTRLPLLQCFILI
jgi:hypothetical protein